MVDKQAKISASTDCGPLTLYLSDGTVALLFQQMARHYTKTLIVS